MEQVSCLNRMVAGAVDGAGGPILRCSDGRDYLHMLPGTVPMNGHTLGLGCAAPVSGWFSISRHKGLNTLDSG